MFVLIVRPLRSEELEHVILVTAETPEVVSVLADIHGEM